MAQAAFRFELTGVKELMKMFDQLPTASMQKTVLRNALKKAGQPIADMAKANCPYDPRPTRGYENSPHLRDTIAVSTSLKASQKKGRIDRSVVTVYIGSSSPHAHLVEFGTTERKLPAPRPLFLNARWVTVFETGRMTPSPFLRTAWDALKMSALNIFASEMKEQIYKAARRLRKRAEAGKLTKTQIAGLSR